MPRPAAKRNRVKAQAKLIASPKVVRPVEEGQRNVGNVGEASSSLAVSSQVQQRKDETPVAKASDYAIESSPLGDKGATGSRPPTRSRGYSSTLSIVGRKGDTSLRVPGTPGFESSILSNFRRRPRQQSILQMVEADDGSSDWDDDDFLGGLSPEDVSTPLKLPRAKSLGPAPLNSPRREPSLPSSDSSRKRKRSLDTLQVPQSSLGIVEDTPPASPLTEIDDDLSDCTVDLPQHSESVEVFSQTLAPPISSSDSSSPAASPSKGRSAYLADTTQSATSKRTKTKRAAAQRDKGTLLSTALLQEKYLPHRRRRVRRIQDYSGSEAGDDSDEDSHGGLEQDDDELGYLTSRPSTRSRWKGFQESNNARNKSKPARKNQRGTQRAKKQTVAITQEPRTYGRRSAKSKDCDKENQPAEASSPLSSALDSDELEPAAASSPSRAKRPTNRPSAFLISEELALQARKFAEVDQWEMEFEDVAFPGSPGIQYR